MQKKHFCAKGKRKHNFTRVLAVILVIAVLFSVPVSAQESESTGAAAGSTSQSSVENPTPEATGTLAVESETPANDAEKDTSKTPANDAEKEDLETPEDDAEEEDTPLMLFSEEEGGLYSLDQATIEIVNKGDGQIIAPDEFKLGSATSTSFAIGLSMSTNATEKIRFTIPAGFSADIMSVVNGFTLTTETLANGDIAYTYAANNTTASSNYDCTVTTQYDVLLANASLATPRTEYKFTAEIISEDGSETVQADSFTITIPPVASYTLQQVDTVDGNFSWTPFQLAGTTINRGVQHWTNQANTNRAGLMTKPLQLEIQKTPGGALTPDWSLDMHLPLYWKALTGPVRYLSIDANGVIKGVAYPHAPRVDICVDGVWKTMYEYTNAFQKFALNTTIPSASLFNVRSVLGFGLPSNLGEFNYSNEQVLAIRPDLITSMNTDLGLGTEKTVYQWLCEASAIRVSCASDVMWDPTYNDQDPRSQLTAAALQDGSETYMANGVTTLTWNGQQVGTPLPLQMTVVNGSDKTLKVAIAAVEKIQMDATTTKQTVETGNAITGTIRDGYAAVFGTARNNDYAYFTDFTASFDFPWEYSPTGTITLCPISESGYSNERNLTCYDYTFTISKTDGTFHKESYNHLGYFDPLTNKQLGATGTPYLVSFTPTLAADEWISNITVTADKVWKQNYTTDTSALTAATENHPLFYANCSSKSTHVNGHKHKDGDVVTVSCVVSTDQTGTVNGEDKDIILLGPKDNIQLWGEDESGIKQPIGSYGDAALEYLKLHLKKYEDTATYENPYIEITGDAAALLNKITYASNVGTVAAPQYNYLELCGYRLNGGDWVDVSTSQAAALLNTAGGYYDLTDDIPSGRYLTGVRLAPRLLNTAIVDTTSANTGADPSDNVVKYYMEEVYYLYLYDQVLPNHLGYNDTLALTYSDISQLNSPLSYNLSFHCDFLDESHTGTDHLKAGLQATDMRTATMVFGDLPDVIFGRDNDYDVAAFYIGYGADESHRRYNVTELTCVAIDDGPASSSTLNAWGEMQSATLSFKNDTSEEKRMLALTKGVSLIGANWQSASYLTPETCYAVIRYKTNLHSEWQTVTPVSSFQGADRAVHYFPLAEGEYVTGVEVDYPEDFLYRAGYSVAGKENALMRHLQLPDVGLLTNGQIPGASPVEGDAHQFQSGEQLAYTAVLSYTDLANREHEYTLNYETARLQPYPTMLVDNFTSAIDYGGAAAVYQGSSITANLKHTYSFTGGTKDIDADKIIHPTVCYQLDKNFTISDTAVLANQLGLNDNQVTLELKNDGSGDSILKIEYGPQGPRTRDITFNLAISLTAKPNASPVNVEPIKNAWLTLDYDTTLNVEHEGEYVAINHDSAQLEPTPADVLDDEDWANDERDALLTTFDSSINIHRFQASSLQFYGTNGSGGGIGNTVTARDGTDANLFGIGETLYAPEEDTTNWVVYVAVPSMGQQITYDGDNLAPVSEYSLLPTGDIQLEGVSAGSYQTAYFVPSGSTLVPGMKGLAVTAEDTFASIAQRDDDADESIGKWMTWDEMTQAERENISYARIVIADTVPAETHISSTLLMKLQAQSAKTKVGDMHAYSSLVYNYVTKDLAMAYPSTSPGNMATNGKGSHYVCYTLSDFVITGQLWQEKNFNNTFETDEGDVLTSSGMTLTLVNENGEALLDKNNNPSVITINSNGSYRALVPSKGTYYLTLSSTLENWLPVIYNGEKIQNGMQFVPGKDKDDQPIAANMATATVEITNQDMQYINGGIEEWGTLTIDKTVSGISGSRTKKINLEICPNGASILRNYTGTFTAADGSTHTVQLGAGSDNPTGFASGDSFTVRLPVGLGYRVTDTDPSYTITIETLENGVHPTDITPANPYVAAEVTNHIVSQTSGGNVEHFAGYLAIAPATGISLPNVVRLVSVVVCIAILAGTLWFVSRKKKDNRKSRRTQRSTDTEIPQRIVFHR